jgi:hypothetical protein
VVTTKHTKYTKGKGGVGLTAEHLPRDGGRAERAMQHRDGQRSGIRAKEKLNAKDAEGAKEKALLSAISANSAFQMP